MNSHLHDEHLVRVGLIAVSVSDGALSNVGQVAWERSGALQIEEALPADLYTIVRPIVVHGGKRKEVEQLLRDWCDTPNKSARCDLILTLGGDGLGPRDVIPDATRAVIERECPGIAEHLRRTAEADAADRAGKVVLSEEGAAQPVLPPALTRGVAGIRGQTLIVNLPSCYRQPADALNAVLPLIPGALAAVTSATSVEPGDTMRPT